MKTYSADVSTTPATRQLARALGSLLGKGEFVPFVLPLNLSGKGRANCE